MEQLGMSASTLNLPQTAGSPRRGATCCEVAGINPSAAMGAAKSSTIQCEDQFASPTIDKPASAATADQETHVRIASTATTGGTTSSRPSQISGRTPNT